MNTTQNTRVKKTLALLLAAVMLLALMPMTALAAGTIYSPSDWADVQATVDGMNDGDTLDLSGLQGVNNQSQPIPGGIITINKSITVKGTYTEDAYLSPATNGFHETYFVLSGNPTITFVALDITNKDNTKPTIGGFGNVIVENVFLFSPSSPAPELPATIEIEGDVTVRSESVETVDNWINPTVIHGKTITSDEYRAGTAIKANNVFIESGRIIGGHNNLEGIGGNAIEANNVIVNGALEKHVGYYIDTATIEGGTGKTEGGSAIVATGNVTINGGGIYGGEGGGLGGNAIIAGGNITLAGEYIVDGANLYWSCWIRGGAGQSASGVSIQFSGDDASPQRILTADKALICRIAGGEAAPYTIIMQKNDISFFNDSRVGFSADTNIPLLKNGKYAFTNEERTRGKLDESTAFVMSAPTVSGTPTDTSVMLNSIDKAEFSKDGGANWQDGTVFTALSPNTEYSFIARIKGTYLNSAATQIKTDKSTPATPSAPTVSGTPTATSITLNTITEAEYSKDNGATWQGSPTFTGLTPNTEYTFIARIKATDDSYASSNSPVSAPIKTDKSTPAAPAAPTVSGTPTATSITLNTIAGAEYSKDGGTTWQDSPIFDGLTPNTDYTFVARIKAVDGVSNASANSPSSLTIKTAKQLEADNPKTGDNSNIPATIAFMIFSLGALTLTVRHRKKRV